jgi:hypothetical protein
LTFVPKQRGGPDSNVISEFILFSTLPLSQRTSVTHSKPLSRSSYLGTKIPGLVQVHRLNQFLNPATMFLSATVALQLRLDIFSANNSVSREQSCQAIRQHRAERSRLFLWHRRFNLAHHVVVVLQVRFDYLLLYAKTTSMRNVLPNDCI